MKFYRGIAGAFFAVAALPLTGQIIPQTPEANAMVALISDMQKKIMAIPSHRERLTVLAADKSGKREFANHSKWRTALPVKFSWQCDAGEKGPFTLVISETEDFANPILIAADSSKKFTVKPYLTNFELGKTYFWKVIGTDASDNEVESAVAKFTTESHPPRWISLRGKVSNFRDLGGYSTLDGKTVRQGMIYRSQGLNDNSSDRRTPGDNRLMAADRDFLVNGLKIRTELDLRNSHETAGMTSSPLGEKVRYVHHSSSQYHYAFLDRNRNSLANNFRLFCDEKNYPIVFHCIHGADRTGFLAFILNGVLGVSDADLAADWEHTFYPKVPDEIANPKIGKNYQSYYDGLAKFGTPEEPLKVKIERFLISCGITEAEIAEFRRIMLE